MLTGSGPITSSLPQTNFNTSPQPVIPSPPSNPMRTLPSTVKNPSDPAASSTPALQRAVVHQLAPSANNPTSCSVLISNRLPARPGFSLPSGLGQWYKAGDTVSYSTVSQTSLTPGSHTIVPSSMGLSNSTIQVGNHLLVDTVASGNQETVVVTAINYSSGVPVSCVATFAKSHDGTYAYPVVVTDLKAPGPFYNDPVTNEGGSYVLVNVETMSVVSLLQDVSLQVPSSEANLVATHVHTGVVDAFGNPMPQPVDLQQHTQNTIGTGQLPNHLPPAPVVERIYAPGDSDPHASTITQTTAVKGLMDDYAVSTWVSNVPQDHSCNKYAIALRTTSNNAPPVIEKFYNGAVSTGGTFTGNVTPSTGLAFDSTGTYIPATGNLVIFILSEPKPLPAGWNTIGSSGLQYQIIWYKKWNNSTDTVNTLLSGNHIGFTAYEIAGQDSTPTIQFLLGSGSNTSYSVGPLTPSDVNTLAIACFSTYGSGGFYDSGFTGETFSNSFSIDGFTTSTYSGPGGPDSGTVLTASAPQLTTSPVSTTLTLPSEWTGHNGNSFFLILIHSAGASTPGPWGFFEERYIPNLPNPGAEQNLTGSYNQLVRGVSYDLGVCFVQTGEVKGPITPFALGYVPGAMTGVQAGLNLIPDAGWTSSVYAANSHAGGFPTSASNPYHYFNLIDNISVFLSPVPAIQANAFIAGWGQSGINLTGIRDLTEVMDVNPGTEYILWCEANAFRCSGTGTDGKGMYIAICSADTDPPTNAMPSTIYSFATVPNGSPDGTQVVTPIWTCPADGSITKVRCIANFNGIHIGTGVQNPYFGPLMFQAGTSPTGFNNGPQTTSGGSLRGVESSTQRVVLNLSANPSTIPTSPGFDSSTAAPVSGGSAPLGDQKPQGWLRVVQATPPAVYQQTAVDSTHPVWVLLVGGGQSDLTDVTTNLTFHYQFINGHLLTEDGYILDTEDGFELTIEPYMVWWLDNGTDSTNATLYFKDGSTASVAYNGTSSSPNVYDNTNGNNVYVIMYLTQVSGVWTPTVTLQSTVPTASQLATCYAYNTIPIIAIYGSFLGNIGTPTAGDTIQGGAGSAFVS